MGVAEQGKKLPVLEGKEETHFWCWSLCKSLRVWRDGECRRETRTGQHSPSSQGSHSSCPCSRWALSPPSRGWALYRGQGPLRAQAVEAHELRHHGAGCLSGHLLGRQRIQGRCKAAGQDPPQQPRVTGQCLGLLLQAISHRQAPLATEIQAPLCQVLHKHRESSKPCTRELKTSMQKTPGMEGPEVQVEGAMCPRSQRQSGRDGKLCAGDGSRGGCT